MIPDFKTYLKESVWMDIHKRSNNEIDRKEEYVDFDEIDPEELCDYIKNHYILPDNIGVTGYDDDNAELYVHILQYEKNQSKFKHIAFDTLQYDYEYDVIKIHKDTYPQLLEKLREKFVVTNHDQFNLKIVPDDLGEPSNKFFMEILDYIVEILPEIPGVTPLIKSKKQVLESVWMDIHKHSNGEIERKEDNLNNLSYLEFLDYLEKTYIIKDSNYDIDHYNSKSNPDNIKLIQIFVDKNPHPSTLAMPVTIFYKVNSKNETLIKEEPYAVVVSSLLFKKYPNLKNELNKKFDVDSSTSQYMVDPKEGKLTNNICVDILDTILDIVEDPLIFKKS